MRKVLKRLLSKLFIVSTIIILQMVWFFLLFYTASAGSRIFDMILKIAAFFPCYVYSEQADENLYKIVMDISDIKPPYSRYTMLFLFWTS